MLKKCALLFISAGLLFACAPKKEPSKHPNAVVVAGQITNPTTQTASLSAPMTDISVDTLSEDGTFRLQIPMQKSGFIQFRTSGEYTRLYMDPGDSIYLTLSTDDFDSTLVYSGDNAHINTYLAEKILMQDNVPGTQELYALKPLAFIHKLDSVYKAFDNHLAVLKEKSFPEAANFIPVEEIDLAYEKANKVSAYENMHHYFAPSDTTAIPDNFYAAEDELPEGDSSSLASSAYKQYMLGKINQLAGKLYQKDSLPYRNATFTAIDSLVQKPALHHFFAYEMTRQMLDYQGPNGVDTLIQHLQSDGAPSLYISQLQEKLGKWDNLKKGQPAPGFTFTDINGDSVSLSDFRGKYVYIDVWATWCGPCRAEQPYMEKVIEQFKDKPVAFVGVSIDSSPKPWEKYLEKKPLKGVQLYSGEGGWNSKIANDYMIKAIPRFLLIDPDGNIVNANAARPSGDIAQRLEKLLEKQDKAS